MLKGKKVKIYQLFLFFAKTNKAKPGKNQTCNNESNLIQTFFNYNTYINSTNRKFLK